MIAKMGKSISVPIRVALRTQRIGFILSRYGVAGALGALGLETSKRGLHFARIVGSKKIPYDRVFGKNLALTFVKLGPTFIKLGQMLATRPDMIGDAVADELKILFDRVPPVSFREIQRILKSELGKKVFGSEFDEIDPIPLASASLSQTHRATLRNGTPIILKVQKDGVAETVQVDLILLEGLARSLDLLHPRLGILQMFNDFKEATLREIDYRQEAKNIERFHQNYWRLFSDSDVVFPRHFPKLTTSRVIALEPMHGSRISDLKRGSTVARKAAALSLAAILEQIFDHGFFHADPHGGNLFFLEDEGRIGFIDLGMVGQLKPDDKRRFLKVLMAILKRDRSRLAQSLWDLGEHTKKADFNKFSDGVQKLLDQLQANGIDNVRLDQMVNQLLVVARKNGIVIPNRYVLLIRSCLMIEGVAKSLDPNLSIFQVAVPIVAKSLMKSYNPLRFFRK